jgi:hypothetical protein
MNADQRGLELNYEFSASLVRNLPTWDAHQEGEIAEVRLRKRIFGAQSPVKVKTAVDAAPDENQNLAMD